MGYRGISCISFEVALGNVGCIARLVYEHVIPGLVLGWSRESYLCIPFFGALESSIDVKHHPSIVESLVMNELANEEMSHSVHVGSSESNKDDLFV